jgi:uncharacterized protein YjiS (DUF1127 family)
VCTECITDVQRDCLLITTGSLYIGVIKRRGTEMNFAKKIADYARYQRTLRELNSLDARQLNDLGITRGDIKSIARGTYSA